MGERPGLIASLKRETSCYHLFGGIEWEDEDRVRKLITVEIPASVEKDEAFKNAKEHSDEENARIEHDEALRRVMAGVIEDHTELYRQFADNPDFRQWLASVVFG